MKKTLSHIIAYAVHMFTASGLVFALLAMYYVTSKHNLQWYFIFLTVTTVIDAVDGTLARKFKVKEFAATVDGALLDNIIDFITYSFLPAYFMFSSEILDNPYAIIASIVVLFVSGYQFCQTNAKTDDHYFVGFPSYWNITIMFLYWMQLGTVINFWFIMVLAVSAFIPVRYIYPSRTKPLMVPTLIITVPWTFAILYVLIWSFKAPPLWFMYYSLFVIVYYYFASFYLNWKYKLMRKN